LEHRPGYVDWRIIVGLTSEQDMSWWNPERLDEHIAPGFSQFIAADIPSLEAKFPEAIYWTTDYFLNSVLRGQFENPHRQLVLGFLRRAQHTLDIYQHARNRTIEHLSHRGESLVVNTYYDALREWESLALNYSVAVELYNGIVGQGRLFEKGDGSPEESLYTIANHIKHTTKSIGSHPQGLPAVPVWLSKSGLHSYADVAVTWNDVATLLTDMAEVAGKLRDPESLRSESGAAG